MREIEKFLRKLSAKEKSGLKERISKLIELDWKNLDIKKLSGEEKFRMKFGRIRVIFVMSRQNVKIIKIDWRNESTYK